MFIHPAGNKAVWIWSQDELPRGKNADFQDSAIDYISHKQDSDAEIIPSEGGSEKILPKDD